MLRQQCNLPCTKCYDDVTYSSKSRFAGVGVGERKTIISTDKLHGKTVWVLGHRGEKRYQIILVIFTST